MRNRSPDERAVDVLGRWLLAEHESGDDEMVELERRMFVANPELAALRTARMDAAIRESTRVVAEDLGVAPESVGPRMVAVAATAIIIELFTGTQESDLEQAAGVALRLIEAAIDSLSRETPSACTMQPVLRPERLHPTNTVCPDNLATDTTDG